MNNIESTTRGKFFPNSKTSNNSAHGVGKASLKRNDSQRQSELDSLTSKDAKVNINTATKDFARIKSAVDHAPDVDNSAKIAKLKAQIQSGTYKTDYEALADKIIEQEFN